MRELRRKIEDIAEAHRLAAVGVASADPFVEARDEIERRVETGLAGKLTFTFADPPRSTDVRTSWPWAERLVVASRSYLPEAGSPDDRAARSGRVARFAVADPYAPLRAALEEMAGRLRAAGHRAEVLVDDNRLVDRAAAYRAGVAWPGKSTMALDPKHGPWIVLGSVVTDALLEVDAPMVRTCGTCEACIPACPTGAIIAPGVLDARRCLAALAQTGGDIPPEFREAMGDRLYGCDDCLDACPPGSELLEQVAERRGQVDLLELLGAADEELRDRFTHFYLPKRDPAILRRNALVALGNLGAAEHVGVVAGYLGHRDPMLRRHAAWALGRIEGDRQVEALRLAAERETDDGVRNEIEMALGR